MAHSFVHGCHKMLKPYIIEVIQFEKLEAKHYKNMRIPRWKSEGIKFLTTEGRNQVEKSELFGITTQMRDMFTFSRYAEPAYSDSIKITKSNHPMIIFINFVFGMTKDKLVARLCDIE